MSTRLISTAKTVSLLIRQIKQRICSKKAYQENVKNQVEFYPLDWQDNSIPSKWNIKGEEVVFDWDNGTNE